MLDRIVSNEVPDLRLSLTGSLRSCSACPTRSGGVGFVRPAVCLAEHTGNINPSYGKCQHIPTPPRKRLTIQVGLDGADDPW